MFRRRSSSGYRFRVYRSRLGDMAFEIADDMQTGRLRGHLLGKFYYPQQTVVVVVVLDFRLQAAGRVEGVKSPRCTAVDVQRPALESDVQPPIVLAGWTG